MKRPPFLSASWRNLVLVNYEVPVDLLRPHLPRGAEPDMRDGKAWCSLVGFQFLDTRVLGIKWPGFVNFPEWNLRFYVRHGDQRGVCFVKEYVPQRWVAFLANTLYGEPYVAARIDPRIGNNRAMYRLHTDGRINHLEVIADGPAAFPKEKGGIDDWFKEHEWGFGTLRNGRLIRYRVEHPRWRVFPTATGKWKVDVDWAAMYGKRWGAMNGSKPDSVVFAEGSPVRVFPYDSL